MNTLGKKVTSTFYKDADGYAQLQARWSELMQDKEACKGLRTEHHLLYAILRGKDWRKGFSPDTNANLLANGANPYDAMKKAVAWVRTSYVPSQKALIAPFGDILVDDVFDRIHGLLPRWWAAEGADVAYTLYDHEKAKAILAGEVAL